ncbi:MAG: hypothetical protein WA771_04610 [Chthoniobacterales bacterium]
MKSKHDSKTFNAVQKCVRRTWLFMGGYVAINVAAIAGVFDDLRQPGALIFALAVAAPIVGQLWATLVLLRDSDEFLRTILAKRFIVASGIVMAFFSVWGLAEVYAQAPHLPAILLYPSFWLAFGMVTPLIRTSH